LFWIGGGANGFPVPLGQVDVCHFFVSFLCCRPKQLQTKNRLLLQSAGPARRARRLFAVFRPVLRPDGGLN
ncbi:TPA: hypothetical protein ACKLTE_002167, partial [Neisseria gonorrhoeae]